MRRAAKVDDNQKQLVEQIRKCGYSVLIISQLKNCADILVGAKGRNYLFEIKDPLKVKSKRKLTPGEDKFHNSWSGQVSVVHTIEEVLTIINL
jgi:Holliday junction resolvase